MSPDALVTHVRTELQRLADPTKVPQMQRYMKTEMPFFGVSRADMRPLWRDMRGSFVPDDAMTWEAAVRALWAGPERELKYTAIVYSRSFAYLNFLNLDAVPLFEWLIRDGAWWDFVDEIASHCVGHIVLRNRAEMAPILERWMTDEDVWIRRTTLLVHLRHKDETDADALFGNCRRQAGDPSFWIRKAIGWALRQYARTDPDAVRQFLDRHGEALSPLSRKEASKHL